MTGFKFKHTASIILMLLALSINAQNTPKQHSLKFGAIPVLSYDADLGLKYGAVVNVFDYAPQKADYSQYLLLRLTHTTRNTLNIQSVFESESIIPNATTFIEAGYTNDQKLDFFGFNGTESIYNQNFETLNEPDFINRNFYTLDRKLIRFRTDIQKNLNDQWRTLTGITYSKFIINSNKETTTTLYDNYIDWGLIEQNEKNGNSILNLKLGLVYDTRNDKCSCTSGQWFEGFLVYAPPLQNMPTFSKLVLTYRYYHSISKNFSASFRISNQTKLTGKIPHYMLPIYFDSQLNQDGLGGAYTMRGIARNRIMANGFTLGNFETRFNIKEFELLGLDFLISGTLFCDLAYINQPYNINRSNIPNENLSIYFSKSKQPVYMGFGPGINIIYNKNNITTVNYGFNTNKQLGAGGLYIGSKFLF